MRLLLHIGQGKAGSTAIQNFLRANADRLLERGVLIPETGQHTNHQDIFTFLTDDVKHHDPQISGARADARKKALGRQFWQAALAQLDQSQADLVILSCENQFRPFSPEALERLCGHLRPHFDAIEVCAYLRDPASHFLSYAQQDLKKRPAFTIPSRTGFRDTLEPWLQHGPGPVTCLRFARDTLANGDAVADFCQRFAGIETEGLAAPGAEVNTTCSAEGMEIMQRFMRGALPAPSRYHGQRAQRMKALVEEADRRCPGYARPRLHATVKAAIEARLQDLDWLKQTFGVVFPDIGAPTLPPEEADDLVRGLDRVSDICAVDADRLAAVQAEMNRLAEPRRGVLDRLTRRARQ